MLCHQRVLSRLIRSLHTTENAVRLYDWVEYFGTAVQTLGEVSNLADESVPHNIPPSTAPANENFGGVDVNAECIA